jgi:purine-binding chemotaxis protein CheW
MTTLTTEPVGNALEARAGKYLSFTLGAEFYGLPVLKVREIIRLTRITPIPQMPEYVRGVINLRGKIVPVVDLRLRFGLGDPTATERTCIIVVQVERAGGGHMHMGLIVDGVEEVFNIAAADIEETPEFGSKLDTSYLLGMAKVREKVTALLDIDRVVSSEALARIGRQGAETAGATAK